MENKDILTGEEERVDTNPENDLPLPLYEVPEPPLTALEFEIAENGDEAEDTTQEEISEKEDVREADEPSTEQEILDAEDPTDDKNNTFIKEEFDIPDSYENDKRYATQSFIENASSIRPTYLPRFTEVSDTYRMQDDPRPRPEPQKPTTVVSEKSEETTDPSVLDPTTERVDEKKIDKVIVTSGAPAPKEGVDEELKILKFSTPIEESEEETNDVTEEVFEPVAEDTEDPQEIEELIETAEETAEVVSEEEAVEEEPKTLTLPDPDTEYSVVSFANDKENYESEEPLGSKEAPQKDHKGVEFTSPVQRDTLKDRFLDSLMSIKVRLVCAALLLLTTIVMDCLKFFGVNPLASVGLGSVPSAAAYVDMQFAICMFLFAIPEVIGAFKHLFKKTFTSELFIVAGLPVVIANNLILATNGATEYVTFAVLYGLQCLSAIIASYIKTDADFAAFKSVSKNVAKNVLDKRLTRELPRENIALDGAIDEYDSKTARMFRTVFVSGFFKRSSITCENSSNIAMILGVGAGISLVTALVSFFINSYSIVDAAQSFTAVFMLALPVFSIFVHKLPYKHSVSESLKEDEGVFVGESSIYESSDVDVVTYEDTEIFGIEDVRIKKVHLYGKAYNTPKAMKQMYALFSVVGGPLDYVFSSSLDRKCPSATDIVIEDDGISGMMEGHRVYAGTADYMLRHGVTIPADDYRTNTSSSDSSKIMYGAEDDEVYVKFFIRYSFSEEFTMILPELKEKKIVPLIYTRDPNITGELVKILTLGEDIIRVMKKYVPKTSEERTYRHIDSGLVTYGDKSNAINMVLLAKKYTSLQSKLAVAELVSMVIGAVLAVVLSVGQFFAVPETLFALWHVAWCVALKLKSRFTLLSRHSASDFDEEYNNQ